MSRSCGGQREAGFTSHEPGAERCGCSAFAEGSLVLESNAFYSIRKGGRITANLTRKHGLKIHRWKKRIADMER